MEKISNAASTVRSFTQRSIKYPQDTERKTHKMHKTSRSSLVCAFCAFSWPVRMLNQWLLLQRFHMGDQCFGLLFGNAFLSISRHVRRLLSFFAFKHELHQVRIR